MHQKLETRLILYEKDHPIKDDHELLAAIESILDEQDSLPVEERDFDLIAEATNTILKLQGYDENHLDEMASEAAASVKTRITDKRKRISNGTLQSKRHHGLRWIIPLVAIIAITTVAVFASPTNRLAITEMTKQLFSSLTPNTVYQEGNIDLVLTDDTKSLNSFDELSEMFNHSLQLPFELENEIERLSIVVVNLGKAFQIEISYEYQDYSCYITIIDPQQNNASHLEDTIEIGQHNVTLTKEDGQIYAEWISNQSYYQVKSLALEPIQSTIMCMRLKNE